jgi:Ca2+-binding EF-hand superfamily protein
MVREVFHKMDADGGGSIEVDEAQKFFSRSAFSKVSAKAMMDAMDKDSSQSLTIDEWTDYFDMLWASELYDEEEMEEEIQGMLEGQPFTLASRLKAGGGRATEKGKSHKSAT